MAVTMKRRPKSMYGEYSTLSAGSKPSGPFRAAQSENSDASKLQVTRPQLCGLREARWACKLFPAFWNVSHFQSKRELLLKKKKKKRGKERGALTPVQNLIQFLSVLYSEQLWGRHRFLRSWGPTASVQMIPPLLKGSRSRLYTHTDCRVQKSHPPWSHL